MKMIRQVLTVLVLTGMLFSMTACGKQTKTEAPEASYIASFFDIPDTVADISRLLIKDNTAYMCCFEESGISYLASMTVGDGEFQHLPLEVEASTSLLDFAFDSKGSTWAVCMDDTDRYSLKKFNRDGQVIQNIDLNEVLETTNAAGAGRDLFLSIDAEGYICVAEKRGNTSAYIFDDKGQFLFPLTYEGSLLNTIPTAEGKIGVCASTANRMDYELLTVDMKSRDWNKDRIYLKATAGLYGGSSNSFYRFDSSSLYSYAAGSQEGRHVFNWSDVGLSASDVHLGELSDGRLIVVAASPNQTTAFTYEMAVLSQGVDERTVLSMVSLTAGPGVVQAVSEFNKTNSQYRIERTEYFPFEQNVSDEEWDSAVVNLNTRIISGDIPDILDMSNLSVQIYHSKGLLEDLYPYIEKDPMLHMEDYFENVFKAISLDGKLPYITDGAAVSTMLADADIMKGRTGWTLQDLENVLNASGSNSISNMSGAPFLKVMLQTDNSFVDWASGKCSFDSPEFIKLLEFAGRIQDNSKNVFGGENLSGTYAAAYETILSIYQITQYRDYYHGNLELLGLPSSSGEYHALKPEVKIGISSASGQKDGAWEFVRTLLTEEHQKSCSMLPIHQGAFDTVMQAAIDGKSIWTWLYENGKATTEDAQVTRQLLSNAAYVVNDNQTLEQIILEEAREYFSGARNAKEAAERIQSRASLYINEQM